MPVHLHNGCDDEEGNSEALVSSFSGNEVISDKLLCRVRYDFDMIWGQLPYPCQNARAPKAIGCVVKAEV